MMSRDASTCQWFMQWLDMVFPEEPSEEEQKVQ